MNTNKMGLWIKYHPTTSDLEPLACQVGEESLEAGGSLGCCGGALAM